MKRRNYNYKVIPEVMGKNWKSYEIFDSIIIMTVVQ